MLFRSTILFLICSVLNTGICLSGTLILPGEPCIKYTGRIDDRQFDNFRFDWSGISIEALFQGSSCAMKMLGAGETFNVFIDDNFVKIIKTDTAQEKMYDLISELKDTVHKLLITKRFGYSRAISEFRGLYLDSGKALLPLPPFLPYRIEFLGASSLNGFGNESSTLYCDDSLLAASSNSYYSYGPVAARLLNAEYAVIALTSKGIARNWASPFVVSWGTFPQYYSRTLINEPELVWDYNRWIPHVVVVNLGTNDFSTRPYPPAALFINSYWAFIQTICYRYPDADIVCLSSDKEPLRSHVSAFVARQKEQGNDRIHFLAYDPIPTKERGCDWHPNVDAHRKIAQKLADLIKPILDRK